MRLVGMVTAHWVPRLAVGFLQVRQVAPFNNGPAMPVATIVAGRPSEPRNPLACGVKIKGLAIRFQVFSFPRLRSNRAEGPANRANLTPATPIDTVFSCRNPVHFEHYHKRMSRLMRFRQLVASSFFNRHPRSGHFSETA